MDLAGHPIGNDPMYSSRMTMQGQPQGAYPMNTGPRGVDHAGYPMNHNMMSQGGQMGYRNTQPAMPGPNRIGPFSSVSPNAVVNAQNNPQMISSLNAHPGTGQYPPGMINRSQLQQQQQMQHQQMQHQQQAMMGMSPNPGGMRIASQNMGAHLGPISTSGDSTPFQPSISGGNNMGMYNRSPNPGSNLMVQNSAVAAQQVAAGQKRNSLSPYQSQYRTAAYSPNTTPPGGPVQPPFQGTPPPPSYNSPSNSLPSVNQASTYQVVPPNQTAPNNSNQLPLPSAAAQEASNSPRSRPGTPTAATSTVHSHDIVSQQQMSPLTAVPNDTALTVTSSQKSSTTDLAASSQEPSSVSQGSTPQVTGVFILCVCFYYIYLLLLDC